MIPNEPIESAAMALLDVTPDVWALQTTGTKDRYRWDAQAALEAAAPFIAAKAWDEGYTTGNAHNGRRDANHYRAAAVRGEG